jgi:hypothetical protein
VALVLSKKSDELRLFVNYKHYQLNSNKNPRWIISTDGTLNLQTNIAYIIGVQGWVTESCAAIGMCLGRYNICWLSDNESYGITCTHSGETYTFSCDYQGIARDLRVIAIPVS